MGQRPAGARYPHATTDVRDADHRFCPVLDAVRRRVEAGKETWGVPHPMPPVPDEAAARDAVAGLYRARNHTGLKRGPCGPRPLSVRATCAPGSDGWIVTVQVWDRATAKREIARRVHDGETLAYNVLREDP